MKIRFSIIFLTYIFISVIFFSCTGNEEKGSDIKTKLNDDDKKEAKFKALREDKTGHLVNYWYIANPVKQYDMVTVTLGGQNYHFNPSIHTGEFLISEYAGQVLADSDDNVQVTITPGIVKSALEAVKALHNLGYVHGDIKLENMALKGDKVKLFDFGEPTMSFSEKETRITNYKTYCHKVPPGKTSLIDDPTIASGIAHKYISGLGPGTMGKLTEELTRTLDGDGNVIAGVVNKLITLGELKQSILGSDYLSVSYTHLTLPTNREV